MYFKVRVRGLMPAFINPFLCIVDICVDPQSHNYIYAVTFKETCLCCRKWLHPLPYKYVLDILHTHIRLLEDMVKDYALGEHLLLVGNQGVGKNKIVNRFLHLLNLPREYLQLHRSVESTSSCTGQ